MYDATAFGELERDVMLADAIQTVVPKSGIIHLSLGFRLGDRDKAHALAGSLIPLGPTVFGRYSYESVSWVWRT